MKKQKISKENIIIIVVAVVLSIGIIVYAVANSNSKKIIPDVSNATSTYDAFAQCLTSKDTTMYGASWCPHCQEQKKAFGTAVQYIKYVECPDNTQLCIDKGIQGYPTWLIGTSTKLEGFDKNKTMKELSDATGCPLP
jgi:glutaredoxin